MCAFESTVSGWPKHLHLKQDEWIYILEGDFEFRIGDKQFRVGPGESVFIPRKTPKVWRCISKKPGRVLDVYQPAGNMEEFFRILGEPPKDIITKEQGINKTYTEAQVKSLRKLFNQHGMDLAGPPPWFAEAPIMLTKKRMQIGSRLRISTSSPSIRPRARRTS